MIVIGTGYQKNLSALYSAYSDTYGEFNDIIMTSEQSRVVVHPVLPGKTIKVIAFAGIVLLS